MICSIYVLFRSHYVRDYPYYPAAIQASYCLNSSDYARRAGSSPGHEEEEEEEEEQEGELKGEAKERSRRRRRIIQ